MNQPNSNPQNQQQNIPFNAQPEILKGVYTNNMTVSHTKEEFQLDFMNMSYYPNAVSLVAKVITSPEHFKRIVAALNDNLKKYESQFGAIDAGASQAAPSASESPKFGF